MLQYTSEEILKGILENNRIVVQYIYDRYFLRINKFIEELGGSKNDAQDVFQDGIVAIYEQLASGEAKHIKSFGAYFQTICKFTWIKIMRDGKFGEYKTVDMEEYIPELEYQKFSGKWSTIMEKERRTRIFFNSFMELGSTCQRMIRYIAYGWVTEDIAAAMNLSVPNASKIRLMCTKELIESVKQELNKIQTTNNNDDDHEKK